MWPISPAQARLFRTDYAQLVQQVYEHLRPGSARFRFFALGIAVTFLSFLGPPDRGSSLCM